MPDIRPGDLDAIHQPLDFFGLNCYNRVLDCADAQLISAVPAVIIWTMAQSFTRRQFMMPFIF